MFEKLLTWCVLAPFALIPFLIAEGLHGDTRATRYEYKLAAIPAILYLVWITHGIATNW